MPARQEATTMSTDTTQISAFSQPLTSSESEAREIIAAWSRQHFLAAQDLASKMVIEEMTTSVSQVHKLVSQCQIRERETVSQPYTGGPVDQGMYVDVWAVDLPIAPFGEGKFTWKIPGSEHIEDCDTCGTSGRVSCLVCGGSQKVNCTALECSYGRCTQCQYGRRTCKPCSGTGKQTCNNCGGSGYRNSYDWNQREPCYACSGGKISCSACDGNGHTHCTSCDGFGNCGQCSGTGKARCTRCSDGTETCGRCSGAGQLKFSDVVKVEAFNINQAAIDDTAGLPEKRLYAASGTEVFKRSAPYFDPRPLAPTCVPEMVERLQAATATALKTGAAIMYQQFTITALPVTRITYRYASLPSKALWIYGNDSRVHAPGAPRERSRMLMLAVGLLLALGIILMALLHR